MDQEQLIKAITGLIPFQDGTVKLAGTEIQGMNIAQKRDAGMSYIRRICMIDGSAPAASIQDNLISTCYEQPKIFRENFSEAECDP